MLKIGVCVSGGGTNLQAIIDSVKDKTLHNVSLEVVISNNKNAYALERARQNGIRAVCLSPKDFESREAFHEAFMNTLDSCGLDLVVLAGFLVILPPQMFPRYQNCVINIHPSLIPAFCGTGFYGLKVHEAALSRGVKLTGATVHFVNEETDGGPILLQKAVEVKDGDTPQTLQKRVMEEAEWVLLPQAIRLIAEGRVTVENGKAVISEGGVAG